MQEQACLCRVTWTGFFLHMPGLSRGKISHARFKTLWIAQFAQSFDLNLANALTGELELNTHIIEGMIMTIAESIAHFDNGTLAGIPIAHSPLNAFALSLSSNLR